MELQSVRSARQIDRVAALAREIWHEAHAAFLGADQIAYMLERFESPAVIAGQLERGDAYDLIVIDGAAVGYCAVRDGPPGTVHLSKLYLRRDQRGTGAAAAVLERLCDAASTRGARRMTLHVNKSNARAMAFYARHGFEIDAPRVVEIGGGFVMDDWRLVRQLR